MFDKGETGRGKWKDIAHQGVERAMCHNLGFFFCGGSFLISIFLGIY